MATRARNKLNVKQVEALIKASRPGRYGDGGGLFLDITPKGSSSWTFIYRSPVHRVRRGGSFVGRTRERGLGPVTLETIRKNGALAAARERAEAARKQIEMGLDPLDIAAPTAKATVPTFAELAEELAKSFEPRWRNSKTAARWRSNIRLYAEPLAAMRVDAITTQDVENVLKPIWESRAETASQLRGNIERVLDAAKARKWRTGENPAAWRGNLSALLPPRRRLTRGHHPALPWQEMPSFMARLRNMDGVGPLALEFAILCASRSNEARGAAWDEFDFKSRIWTVPGGFEGRMKEEEDHQVPLSSRAFEILQAVGRLPRGPFVFPGSKRGRPLSDMSLSAVLRRMGQDEITVHGFRATFRMWCGDTGAAPREIAEMCLSHTIGSRVEVAYNRSTALERRRVVMEAWAAFCGTRLAGEVVPLRPACSEFHDS